MKLLSKNRRYSNKEKKLQLFKKMAKFVKIIQGRMKGTTCFVKQPSQGVDFYETFQDEKISKTDCVEVDYEANREQDKNLSEIYMN